MARPLHTLLQITLVLGALALPAAGHAWSAMGHRLIGALAEQRIGPDARRAVAELLAGEDEPTLAGVAAWADTLRDDARWRWTAPLHYVRIHDAACGFQAARDCHDGLCVAGAIERFRAELADPARSRAERRDALKFLVHFVGDVHQPLHSGHRDDRGGNRFQVRVGNEGTNLHRVWDHHVLVHGGRDQAQLHAALAPALPAPGGFDPIGWAEASCRLTNAPGFYPRRPGTLPAGYLDTHAPLADRRIADAAAELAAVLDAVFERR